MLPFGAAMPAFAGDSSIPSDRALVVGSADSQWTSNAEHSIVLNKGALVIIAGKEPVKVETRAGSVEISPNLEAVVQQDSSLPITVTAIACRRADASSPDCALTVSTNDDSTYKVYPGKQLKLTAGESVAEVTDVVMLKQQPELAQNVRKAANDLAAAAFQLLGDAKANTADRIASSAQTLMAGSAPGPVKLYVSEGAELVALQPGSIPMLAAKPKPKADASTEEAMLEEHQMAKLQFLGDTAHSAWNAGH
jgi:hypothetical protein